MKTDKIYYLKDQPKDPAGWIQGLNKSGYAGVTRKGMIVDRRVFPDAVPIEENRMFGVVKPKDLPQPKENEYQCEACMGIFEKTISDEEQLEEYKKVFPEAYAQGEKSVIVCEDCYEEIMKEMENEN